MVKSSKLLIIEVIFGSLRGPHVDHYSLLHDLLIWWSGVALSSIFQFTRSFGYHSKFVSKRQVKLQKVVTTNLHTQNTLIVPHAHRMHLANNFFNQQRYLP